MSTSAETMNRPVWEGKIGGVEELQTQRVVCANATSRLHIDYKALLRTSCQMPQNSASKEHPRIQSYRHHNIRTTPRPGVKLDNPRSKYLRVCCSTNVGLATYALLHANQRHRKTQRYRTGDAAQVGQPARTKKKNDRSSLSATPYTTQDTARIRYSSTHPPSGVCQFELRDR